MVLSGDDALKLQNLQSVTVMEVTEGKNGWDIVIDSDLNRWETQNTPMTVAGPAAGHELLKTDTDPTGLTVLGTMNNFGADETPWGT